jgi:hypothetical protein
MPSVNGSAAFDHERVVRKNVSPAATISGPNRLSGRRHQATAPAKT